MDPRQSELEMSSQEVKSSLHGGLHGQGAINDWLWIDFSVDYGETEFIRKTSIFGVVAEYGSRIHIPILLRVDFLRFFSIGTGFYASYRVGDVKTSAPESTETTSARDSGEHGLEAALGLRFPLGSRGYYLFLDYRYTQSLTYYPGENQVWEKVGFSVFQNF